MRLYWIFYNKSLRIFIAILLVALLVLGIFEKPAVISLPGGVSQAIEIFFMLILLARMGLYFGVYGWQNFKTNWWKILKFTLILATIVDSILSILYPDLIRVTRILRPLIFAEHFGVLRQKIALICKTIARMPEFIFLMFFNVIFYSLVAYTLFSPNKNDPYFGSLYESFMSIFILQTTANYPDVTIPAVRKHPAASIFFVSFLLIQLYFIFNLNIATVFNLYKEQLDRKKVATYIRNRVAVLAAFRMLDPEQKGFIELRAWQLLFRELRPWTDQNKAIAKFEKENVDDTGRINLLQFLHLADDIMRKIDKPIHVRHATRFIYFPMLAKIVRHEYVVSLSFLLYYCY
jgi:hypothetical protein